MNPPMQNRMEIVGIEKVKDSPAKPEFAIYHVTLLPENLVKGQDEGRGMLESLGLDGRFSGMLESAYIDNDRAFRTVLAMTQHTINTNNYRLGSKVLVTAAAIVDDVDVNNPNNDPVL